MAHLLKCHPINKTDFVRGENCHLYDAAGRRYVDLESGIWCTVLGHCHPRINRVLHEQVDRLMHLGTRYPNAQVEAAAVDVLDIVGIPEGRCTFLSSGSEAVEFGCMTARRVTGRPLLLTFSTSYLAAYGSSGRKSAEEWCVIDWTQGADAGKLLEEIPFDKIGGFVFEPGGSGISLVRFPPASLVEEIARRVREAGGLIVANEITTGMGRTGKLFGFQHYAVHPDIVALGKGLGGGYPVSAVAMTAEVAAKLEAGGLRYAQSHQNDPLGCVVAREVIAVMREGGWVERGNEVGARFLEGLRGLVGRHAVLKEARGRGMLLGVEFHPHERISGAWAFEALLEQGFLTCYTPAGNVLRFDPALTIEERDVAALLECFDSLLAEAR